MKISGKEKYLGNIYPSKNFGEFVVLDYKDKHNILIKFIETDNTANVALCNLRSGAVRDRYKPSIYGVGVIGDEICHKDYKALPDYVCWKDMLDRLFNMKSLKRKWYEDCTISESFKNLTSFRAWAKLQKGFNKEGWQLDKDILVKGNRTYSEDTCCFVPKEINILVLKIEAVRGLYPIGVTKSGAKYMARMMMYGKSVWLGYFETPNLAFQAYKKAKEAHIKEVANKWKGEIDVRVYEALMNWSIEITD